mmetsp:Transcript_668/g.961  ORF Transcript_668/g.961 Transcript_668/m.961 type:complete len:207 (+) Transcript_668:554-1174(+)
MAVVPCSHHPRSGSIANDNDNGPHRISFGASRGTFSSCATGSRGFKCEGCSGEYRPHLGCFALVAAAPYYGHWRPLSVVSPSVVEGVIRGYWRTFQGLRHDSPERQHQRDAVLLPCVDPSAPRHWTAKLASVQSGVQLLLLVGDIPPHARTGLVAGMGLSGHLQMREYSRCCFRPGRDHVPHNTVYFVHDVAHPLSEWEDGRSGPH